MALGALGFWIGALYLSLTVAVPQNGGQYIEGQIAQPRYINPLFSQTSEADADLVKLLYDGLFGYDLQGNLVKRMASDYTVTEEGKRYTIFLKNDIRFHDGEELTAEDVAFTVRTVQDPAAKSPLRSNWVGVEVATPDRYTVTFSLKKAYFGFLDNLTLGILPKHIWESVAPEYLTLAEGNLIGPIGSGPYRYADVDKDPGGTILSYHLRSFDRYHAGEAHIRKFTVRFYPDEDSAIDAFNREEIHGIHSISPERLGELSDKKRPRVYAFGLPRTFAVFLNTNKSVALAYDEVREALALSVNREELVKQVLGEGGLPMTGPFLPFMFGYDAAASAVSFDPERAKRLLEEKGWTPGTDGIRSKNGTPLTFDLATPDWPELVRTADLLSEAWRDLGVRAEVKVLPQIDLQQNLIRPREYQALLFGEGPMLDPDLYSFWHSSQKNDPGLNLAFFEDKRADEILLEARETLDGGKRTALYREFQTILQREHPAVFLFSPDYLYVVSQRVRGIAPGSINAPADRLLGVTAWYLETSRSWKR